MEEVIKDRSELYQFNKLLDKMEQEVRINNKGVMSTQSMPTVYQYFHKLYKFLENGYE